jgi:hypothetical protein
MNHFYLLANRRLQPSNRSPVGAPHAAFGKLLNCVFN